MEDKPPRTMVTMDDKEFAVVSSAMDACRNLIAAGKVQRWDVVKWGVTVNLALATVAATVSPSRGSSFTLFAVAAMVSIGSLFLVLHYNRRMTGARRTAVHLTKVLTENGIDYDRILDTDIAREYSRGESYDREELMTFGIILTIAPFLVFLRYFVGWVLPIPN
jgi:hypothetical protein